MRVCVWTAIKDDLKCAHNQSKKKSVFGTFDSLESKKWKEEKLALFINKITQILRIKRISIRLKSCRTLLPAFFMKK